MAECQHMYDYLESSEDQQGRGYWLFFCKKCLDIKQVAKESTFRYQSDLK